MTDIAEYDTLDYDYSKYWEKRLYENLAEKNLLNKIFSNKRGNWFLDVGGSYGRLTSTYYSQYNNPVILDYSLKTLIKNKAVIVGKYPNTQLIAANAYKMPFKENTFDGALMVRVLHHIEDPKTYLKELKRVMGSGSWYIQEFANKIHIKAVIRSLLKLNFKNLNKEPYLQPKITGSEGSKKDYKHIFYNYHPGYITSIFRKEGFKVKKSHGCSFLRSPFIKKFLGENIMLFLEKIMQNTLSWTNLPPSIFLETKVMKRKEEKQEKLKLEDILACPSCKNNLLFEKNTKAKCTSCSNEYYKKEGIWDFRIK